MRPASAFIALGIVAAAGAAKAVVAGPAGVGFQTAIAPEANLGHHTETASSGDVEAQLSYSYDPKTFEFSKVSLRIVRGGTKLLSSRVPPVSSSTRVQPANYWEKRKSIFARDLDGDGEPEVFLSLYWGGAHCCYFTYLYRYLASGYQRLYHLWGDPGYRLRDLNRDGKLEFVGADYRFAYEFTDFADSLFPLQVWRYGSGRFVNVTRRFPASIRGDAVRAWRLYLGRAGHHGNVYGILAAWAADECLVNRCGKAFTRLRAIKAHGRLQGGGLDEKPAQYLIHLRRFLQRTGYVR
jgi:hypothetical protein